MSALIRSLLGCFAVALWTQTARAQATLYFIHPDHLDTPRLVANAAGTTVWRWHQQEPFGDSLPDENPSGLGTFDLPLRFPGQRYDNESGLTYNYRRDYNAANGRYVQSDPIGLYAGLNTYAYVASAPLVWRDFRGLAIGDYPPPPPGYDARTWRQGTYENTGRTYLDDPVTRRRYILHPEDRQHWRHWDVQGPDGDDEGPWPPNSGKPRNDRGIQQKKLNPNQCEVDPSGDAAPWEPLDPVEKTLETVPWLLTPETASPVPRMRTVPLRIPVWMP